MEPTALVHWDAAPASRATRPGQGYLAWVVWLLKRMQLYTSLFYSHVLVLVLVSFARLVISPVRLNLSSTEGQGEASCEVVQGKAGARESC